MRVGKAQQGEKEDKQHSIHGAQLAGWHVGREEERGKMLAGATEVEVVPRYSLMHARRAAATLLAVTC